jgi:hypothetical protein
MGGATANATWFRIIRPTSGAMHNGTEATAVKFTGTTHTLRGNEIGAQVQDVAAQVTANQSGDRYGVWLAKSDSKTIGCFSHDAANSGTGDALAFVISDGFIRLCEGVRADQAGYQLTHADAENCLAYACADGFTRGFGTVVVTNCVSTFSSGSDFPGPPTSTTFSMSGDATATGTGSVAYSDDNAFTFVNVGADDYHLDGSDTGAKDLGTDLSGTFDDDIDFDIVTSWSAGHDAQVAAGAGAGAWPSPTKRMAYLLNR